LAREIYKALYKLENNKTNDNNELNFGSIFSSLINNVTKIKDPNYKIADLQYTNEVDNLKINSDKHKISRFTNIFKRNKYKPSVDIIIQEGQNFQKLQRWKESQKKFEKAISIDPTNIDALVGNGNSFYGLKKYNEALKMYKTILSIDPTNIDALVGNGNSFYGLKKYNLSITSFSHVLSIDPTNIDALVGNGNSFYGLKKYNEALDYYSKALSIDPNKTDALLGKAESLIKIGKKNEGKMLRKEIKKIK
jgi:tetratricopeptide (TPR) repeat protein